MRDGIDPVVGHRRRHQAQVSAGHVDRALPEVEVYRLVGVARDDVERAQHVPDGAVPVARVRLGRVHRLVEGELSPCIPRVGLADSFESRVHVGPGHQRRSSDRTGVDHRIARPLGHRVETDLVEGFPRRFDVDLLRDGLRASVGEREGVGERFRNRLDGERQARVAHLVYVSVDRGYADTERIGGTAASSGM